MPSYFIGGLGALSVILSNLQNPGGYSNANRQIVSSLDEAIGSWRSDIAQLQSEAIANESNRAQFINTLSPNLAERIQRHTTLSTVIAADLDQRRQLYQEQLQQFSGVLPEFHDNGIKGYSQELRQSATLQAALNERSFTLRLSGRSVLGMLATAREQRYGGNAAFHGEILREEAKQSRWAGSAPGSTADARFTTTALAFADRFATSSSARAALAGRVLLEDAQAVRMFREGKTRSLTIAVAGPRGSFRRQVVTNIESLPKNSLHRETYEFETRAAVEDIRRTLGQVNSSNLSSEPRRRASLSLDLASKLMTAARKSWYTGDFTGSRSSMDRAVSALDLATRVVSENEWYTRVKYSDNDPYAFYHTYENILFQGRRYYNIRQGAGPVSGGFLYAVLKQEEKDRILGEPNHAVVRNEQRIETAQRAQTYKDFFLKQSDALQVPFFVGVVGAIPDKLTSLVGVAGTLIDVLLKLSGSDAHRARASELAALMGVGGIFQDVAIIAKDSQGHDFLTVNIVYKVRVATEDRVYALSSATYALQIE